MVEKFVVHFLPFLFLSVVALRLFLRRFNMRLLSISSTGGTITLTAGSSSHNDIHGFAINLLESQPARLRFRSVQFGCATVVSLKLGEVDCADTAQQPFSETSSSHMREDEEDVYIVVATDEGFTEATLLRIAALINEVCIFLRIGPKSKSNLHYLRMVLQYIDARLGCNDLGFLSESIETVFNPAITATGYSSNPKGLLDELVRANIFEDRSETERMPGYAAVLFGNKSLMETTVHVAEEAAKLNDVDKFHLNDADRYIIHLVASAMFAVPHPRAAELHTQRERRVTDLERRLQRFEIHRHNVTRAAARAVLANYCAMLRQPRPDGSCEGRAADFYQQSFEELFELMSEVPPPTIQQPQEGAGGGGVVDQRSRYHSPDIDFDFLSSQIFTISNCCFRNSDYLGVMQLFWAPSPEPQPEEWGMADICPTGYGLAVVYFPPKDEKESTRLEQDCPSLVPSEPLRSLANEVLGSVEMSFNRFQWLLSPPVESYETPGLIHFIAVDRRDNTSVCGSFERMMHQKSPEVCAAVRELQRTMAQCMSKAHELISQGFSEGLWGHLGMQFFFAVGVAPQFDGANPTQAAQRAGASAPTKPGNDGSSGSPLGIFGGSDQKKLPSNVLQHIALRPMLVPDVLDDVKQTRVIEMYCMFIGCMSPLEVCQSVEWLRSSRLFA